MSRLPEKKEVRMEGPSELPRASLVAQMVKSLPAMQETWVRSQGWDDPLEKEKATHSSVLAWRIPWTVYSPWACKKLDTTEQLSLIHTWLGHSVEL